MDGSLLRADWSTHCKVVSVALVAATAAVWIGIAAHLSAGSTTDSEVGIATYVIVRK